MSAAEVVDVVVIGGGIAGLHAALTAARDGCSVKLVDAQGGGGRLLNLEQVHDYPAFGKSGAGPDIAAELVELAFELGVEFGFDQVETLEPGLLQWRVVGQGEQIVARAVVVATGHCDSVLGLDGEVALRGHGLSYCASCDGPLFSGKQTIVIGGSDWAVDEALYLAGVTGGTTLVSSSEQLECTPDRVKRLGEAGVDYLLGSTPIRLDVSDGRLRDVVVRTADGERALAADGLFPFVDMRPALAVVPSETVVDGHLAVDGDGRTAVDGLFAAGDVTYHGEGLLMLAAGQGQRAGAAASRHARATSTPNVM